MTVRVALLRKIAEIDPNLREVILLLLEEMERQRAHFEQQVTKTEFNELKTLVMELVEAQKRTDQQIRELTEAQKRTEQRVEELAEALKETQAEVRALAEAQKRTEQRVEELAEALKETQAEVRALAEAQKRTEQRVEELAEAQKRTERRFDFLHQRVEGLSDTVGYTLENQAYRFLPRILKERTGVQVEGRLLRRYVRVKGTYRQVNVFGYGLRTGQRVLIVGEVKTRPSRREIDKFLKLVGYLERQEGLSVVPLLVAHDFHPEIEVYLKAKGVLTVWSYDLVPIGAEEI